MLCRLKPLSSAILLNLYVLPITDYCSISFNSCPKSLSDRLDRMHCRAMRYLTLGETGRRIDKIWHLHLSVENTLLQFRHIKSFTSYLRLICSCQFNILSLFLIGHFETNIVFESPQSSQTMGGNLFILAVLLFGTTDLYSCTPLNSFKSLFLNYSVCIVFISVVLLPCYTRHH